MHDFTLHGFVSWMNGSEKDEVVAEKCGLCGESTDGEDCAEIVMMKGGQHVVGHAQCCVWAVEQRQEAVWA